MDRLELNAMIERLIDSRGADDEAREAVVRFARTLKQASPVAVEGTIIRSGGKVSGQTPQHGQVDIEDERPETKEFAKGIARERVGYYKVTLQTKRLVLITHFWKADTGTQSETELAPEWAIGLDKHGEAEWFGERARKPILRIPFTHRLVIDISRDVYIESWGASPSRQHKGGFYVAVSISSS